MRATRLLSLVVACMCGATLCLAASEPDKPITVRVASYNVEFGKSATPEQIGEMFAPYKLDIIGFDEAPDGDWTARVGKVLGMPFSFAGKISSANHKDKYKTILSRTPLEGTEEYELTGRGWNPASAVRATTKIEGVSFAFYSLHICRSGATDGHAYSLATEVLPIEKTARVIVVGDFNNNIDDSAMKTIEAAGFKSTWPDLKIDVSKKFTYNAQDPRKNLGVIDHIFYNTSADPRSTGGGIIELEKPLSDHKPIWAEIVFPRNLDKAKVHKESDPLGRPENKPTGNTFSTPLQQDDDLTRLTPLDDHSEESSINVMSYNIFRGGTMRKQPLSQTARVIQEAKADVVGVQETRSPKGDNAEKLAKLLGWNLYVGIRHKCILTRHEIVERLNGGIKVKLPSGQHAYIFTLHLASNPYQPYQLLSIRPKWHKHWDTPFIKTEAEAIAAATEARCRESEALLRQIT